MERMVKLKQALGQGGGGKQKDIDKKDWDAVKARLKRIQ
jgi:hypothetical protein